MAACPSCRAPVEPGDRFCSNCGFALQRDCTVCGSQLVSDAAACASCGTKVRPTAATVEHRLVTALYVDLVGSTGLAEALDPENLANVVGAVHAAVSAEVQDRGGAVGAFVGDGVLGVFGLPTAHDDDPERALGAARAILHRVEQINSTLGVRFGVSIAARIGINTGDLLAPAGEEPNLGTLAGDVLNVAARLQEAAQPGSIVVAERTARSAARFRFDDLGLLDIRGRARPIHAFDVVGESEVDAPTLRSPLHGRISEQAQLREIYRRVVAEGRPHLVTVIGDAGVGKSRLVREFVDWADENDQTVTTLSGRCLPYGEDITYRPLAEVITDLTGISSETPAQEAGPRLDRLVAKYISGDDAAIAADALLQMMGMESLTDQQPTPRRVRELLLSTWRSLLSGLAADGPVLVVIEDIHWAGDALLDLLEHVVRRSEGPLLVVSPARPELVDRHQWEPGLDTTTMIRLGPLELEEAERLAAHLLAEAGLNISATEAIVTRADGNPFFIEELVREMQLRAHDAGHDTVEQVLPATIQGVISARIDLLGPQERRVLQAASVVGRIFWPSAVESITRLPSEDLAATLDRLESLQLIRVNLRSAGEMEYIFQHILIREAAYGRLSRPDLARMHAALADWLEVRAEERPEAAERLAFHTYRAHQAAIAIGDFPAPELGRLRTLSVQRLIRSAIAARGRAAFGRSRQLAEAALAIADGPHEVGGVQEQIGLTQLAEYDGDAAWTSLRTAVEAHLSSDSVDLAAVARIAASAVQTPMRWQGTMRNLPPMTDVLRYINIGIESAGAGDSEALAGLLIALAFAPITPGPEGALAREVLGVDEGREAGQRAREMAVRLGLPHLESAALDVLQNHALWGGRIQQAAEIMGDRLHIVDAVNHPWEVGDTYAMAAWLSYDLGDYSLARDRALHGFRRTIDDAPSVALHTLTWATIARVQTGEWDDVARALTKADELLDPERRTRPPIYASALYAAAALVAEFRGRTEEADRLLAILTDVWSSSDWASRGGHPHARWTKHTGPIYIRRGDFDTAAQLVESVDAERIGREGDRLSVGCELIAARSDWDEADSMVAETRVAVAAYGLGALHAHADRLEGRASLAGGDTTGGLALLSGARERFEALGDHWEAARTAIDIAAAGGQVDHERLAGFLQGLGAIDEIQRLMIIVDPLIT
jgi:class 3 adenylate cyclase